GRAARPRRTAATLRRRTGLRRLPLRLSDPAAGRPLLPRPRGTVADARGAPGGVGGAVPGGERRVRNGGQRPGAVRPGADGGLLRRFLRQLLRDPLRRSLRRLLRP